jgi:endonuclease G
MRITEVLSRDDSVRNEVAAIIGDGRPLPKGEAWSVTPEMVEDVIVAGRRRPHARGTRPYTEAVIREFARPVLMIRKNRIELPRSAEMRKRLLPARLRLEARLPSVGRIEFTGHPRLRWGGTGWVIADGVIVTNRHVAELFAERRRRGFGFKKNPISNEELSARIDFREEYKQGTTPAFEVQVKKILFVERDVKTMPDVAFLQLEVVDELPPPIPVADDDLRDDADVAVVGYPARDPYGSPSEAAARRIFGDIYEVKRFAPGKVLVADAGSWYFTHDATTLGGNSGSVVLDLRTGAACGLHFQGELEKEN